MRPLLLLFALMLPGPLFADDKAAQAILNLLDYVAVEYPSFVQQGKVLDPGEYAEQVEFSAQVRELIGGLPDNPERSRLRERAGELHALIQAQGRWRSGRSPWPVNSSTA